MHHIDACKGGGGAQKDRVQRGTGNSIKSGTESNMMCVCVQ